MKSGINDKLNRNIDSFNSYFKHTLVPIVVYGTAIGLITGAFIWAYSLAVEFLGEKSREIYAYTAEHPAFLPLLFAGLAAMAGLSYLNARFTPEVSGSGVPYSEGVMRGLLPLKWLKTLVSMTFGSMISFISGLPLGSEGPSVLIGSCIGGGVNAVGGKQNKSRYAWRRQSVTGGAAAGFAVAFNAPLAGIIFALEEGHKRFSPMILLPASASVIVATLTANGLTAWTGHGIQTEIFSAAFASAAEPNLRQIGYLLLLGLMMGAFSVLFSIALNFATNAVRRLKINGFFKILAVFLLTGIAGLLIADATGGGALVINKIASASYGWKTLLLLLAVRLVLIVFSSAGGVTGGLFIPILSTGALFGGLIAKLMTLMGMDASCENMIVIISMCAFLGGVMRSPITAIVLVVEMTGRLAENLWAACLVILLSYFIIELFNIEPIYDNSLGALVGKRMAGKKRKLVEYEVEIEAGSFAVDRSVRDILWPANTLVIKVKKTDADGNIIYRMDKDGERKIHAGDKFVIQAETYDAADTYRQLAYIVKRPGYAEFFGDAEAAEALADAKNGVHALPSAAVQVVDGEEKTATDDTAHLAIEPTAGGEKPTDTGGEKPDGKDGGQG